jgi:Na+/H+-dicarboxylate symporter
MNTTTPSDSVAQARSRAARPFHLQLWFLVLLALAAGIALGLLSRYRRADGIHRLMSQALTPTNLIGNGVATLVIAKWEGALDQRRLQQGLSGKDLEQR